jgi:hypothetical protein
MSVRPRSSLRVDCRSTRRIVAAVCVGILAPMSVAYAAGDYRNVDGHAIYLGVVPAAIAQGHPPDHPEGKMHGGAPWGRGQHHVMVAVFDAASGARIDDAVVTAKVGEPGLTPVQRRLEPMLIAGAMSYGNYFALSAPGPYRIELHIARPDAGRPIVTTFTYAPPR